MYLFDTNILIYFLKGVPEVLHFFTASHDASISIISWIELLSKKHVSALEMHEMKVFLNTFLIVDISRDIAEQAVLLKKNGLKIADAIIGATALQLKVPLVTHDTVFHKVSHLQVINPFR